LFTDSVGVSPKHWWYDGKSFPNNRLKLSTSPMVSAESSRTLSLSFKGAFFVTYYVRIFLVSLTARLFMTFSFWDKSEYFESEIKVSSLIFS
jgi:hypothetical protein